ncbi:cytochrome c-type biogenesis protein CcmH/NrfF [Ancylobacter sp. 3268]|nr:cytochrome c-type biogenesis protein CcmH/NrfF [Ancylobacter sp. 3268]
MSTADFLLLLIMPVGALVVGGIVYLVASRDHHPHAGPAE